MMEYLVSHQQYQLEIMNDDDFIGSSPYLVRADVGHGSGEGKTVIADRSETILGGLDAIDKLRDKLAGKFDGCETDSIFHVPRERKVLIQSKQSVPLTEIIRIPVDRREAFIDHVKERALQGMLEQADLVNAISYEEEIDHITQEKIIIAKLKVIIDE